MTKKTSINHDEIALLSNSLFDDATRLSILQIATQVYDISKTDRWKAGYQATVEPVREAIAHIDEMIGGIGINNLLVSESGTYTGKYPIEERPIHRPLQYALVLTIHSNYPRFAVQESCEHIEGILKSRFQEEIRDIDHMPLGKILGNLRRRSLLKEKEIQRIAKVATILNIAKHEHGDDAIRIPDPLRSVESQVFNIHEAISMYFICRKLGVHLLSDFNGQKGKGVGSGQSPAD